ncbi:techylectin-like protein [Argiope bruennichi]|uniref:techylectin-like protein n=1 Tax=Argiope bruennichi TaxID=94029 RepID=UPI0024951551|nr:techylectin-like protein [Argiope bruennichi]
MKILIPSCRKHLYIVGVILLLRTAVIHALEDEKTDCGEKEKALALLETAEDLLSKAKVFYPTCKGSASNESDCGAKERSLAYIEISRNLLLEVKDHFPSCPKAQAKEHNANDCSEILAKGQTTSGVYKILLKSPFPINQPIDVFCDMDTEGGGWTVIQRRGDFPEQQDFNKDWETYRQGFGKLTEEFWLGNEYIYALTNQGEYEVRFDLVDDKGEHRYAVYDNFRIDDENSSYALHIRNYSGDAGDSMKSYDGAKFSTRDRGDTTKAQQAGGGWWLNDSRYCNLNGIYKTRYPTSIHWFHWHKFDGLTRVEIKVRQR